MINWGIIGLGNSAKKFAQDLKRSKNARLFGVASREAEKAKQFSQEFGVQNIYDSYEMLAQNPEIDIIYITTPHSFHFTHTMLCLKSNKAVLCEKPLGMNAAEVKTLTEEARACNLFLMEGLSTRFLPATEKALSLLEKKFIGDVISVRADFDPDASSFSESRLFDKKLGGGSLLDIGMLQLNVYSLEILVDAP